MNEEAQRVLQELDLKPTAADVVALLQKLRPIYEEPQWLAWADNYEYRMFTTSGAAILAPGATIRIMESTEPGTREHEIAKAANAVCNLAVHVATNLEIAKTVFNDCWDMVEAATKMKK